MEMTEFSWRKIDWLSVVYLMVSCGSISVTEASVECYTDVRGADYRGYQFVTKKGKLCQNWTSDHPHIRHYTPELFPNSGLGDHNYCRNPRSGNDCGANRAWCYTTDPRTRWEYCEVGRPQRTCQFDKDEPTTVCHSGWLEHDDNCYFINLNDKRNFTDAENVCRGHGAQLASILRVEEHCTLTFYIQDQSVWIGLQNNGSNTFNWLDGRQVDFQNWGPGEPYASGNVSTDGQQICVGISGLDGQWYAYLCEEALGFICKMTTGKWNVETTRKPNTHSTSSSFQTGIDEHTPTSIENNADKAKFTTETTGSTGSKLDLKRLISAATTPTLSVFFGIILVVIFAVRRYSLRKRSRRKPSGTHQVQQNQYVGDSNDDITITEDMPLPKLKTTPKRMRDYYALPENEDLCERFRARVNGQFWIPFGHLDIHETIGEGNYGLVLKGKWIHNDVAIKILKEKATDEHKENIEIELNTMIDITAKCCHPNVVRLLGWSYFEGNLYIVMEYLSGGSLHNLLTSKSNCARSSTSDDSREIQTMSLTPRDVYQFGIDVARGMEYLSDHNIIHRDLASRNVLLDDNQSCKVSDFGLARNVMGNGEYIVTSKQELPARWMAIESLMSSTFTTKSDVWSFGVLLWEMTSNGRMPYDDCGIESHHLLANLTQGVRLVPPPTSPPVLKDLMEACWKHDPADRPTFKSIRIKLENGMKSDPGHEWSDI